MKVESLSRARLLVTPWTAAYQAPPPMGYPEETKTEKDTCIPLFFEALFTIARKWKQPRCPAADEWKVVVHIQWNITQLLKRTHLSQS